MSNAILQWKSRKKRQLKAHQKLVKQLRTQSGKRLDRYAAELHETTFERIDCLDCANCCSGLPPIVNKTDASRIAKKLGLSEAKFALDYLTTDEDGDTVMQQTPCTFLLENKKCSIYEFRPKACREYPHTDTQFSKNLNYHATNGQHCPATFHILETMLQNIPG